MKRKRQGLMRMIDHLRNCKAGKIELEPASQTFGSEVLKTARQLQSRHYGTGNEMIRGEIEKSAQLYLRRLKRIERRGQVQRIDFENHTMSCRRHDAEVALGHVLIIGQKEARAARRSTVGITSRHQAFRSAGLRVIGRQTSWWRPIN